MTALAGCARLAVPEPFPAGKEPGAPVTGHPVVLSSNENPLGPPPSAVEAASNAVQTLSNRYAREQRDDLIHDLARFYGLDSNQVLLGCGAIELLKIAADVFASAGKPPVMSDPVYEALNYYAGLRYVRSVGVPAARAGTGHDLETMLSAVSIHGGMVYVCNPCNPTGTVLDKSELADFIRQVPGDVVIVVDEAYAEYVEPDFFSCIPLVRSGMPNLLVIRTFSKVYGMAGLRVGYCVGNSNLIAIMADHRLWNNINQAGAAAARAALRDRHWVEQVRRENRQTLRRFCVGLDRLGISYIPSCASYVLLTAGRPWAETYRYLKSRGIIGGRYIPSMPLHIRMSIGSAGEMAYCLDVLQDFIQS